MKSSLFFWISRNFNVPGPSQLYKTLKSLDTKEKLLNHFIYKTDSKDFIENLRVAISVFKTHHNYPFTTIIPEIHQKFDSIQSQLHTCDYSDLSSLLYILKISKEHKMALLYTPKYEKNLLSFIEKNINDDIDQKILMNLFRDLGLINKLFDRIEKIVIRRLQDPNQVFSVDDLRKIFNAITSCKIPRLLEIENLAIERLENINFLLASNSELSECLRVLVLLNKKRDINDLLRQILNSLVLRKDFLTFRETKQILELYTLTNKIDKGCLYDTLYRIQELMAQSNDIEIIEILECVKYYRKVVRNESEKIYYGELTELFIDKIINLHKSKQLSFIKTFETLSDLEDLCVNLPTSIKKFLNNYDNIDVTGYWKLIHLKIKSKDSQLPPKVFENFENLKSNLEISSIYLKARALEKICYTKSFDSNPQLIQLYKLLINGFIENCNSLHSIKKLITVFDSIKKIISKNDLKKLLEKCFGVFRKSSEGEAFDLIQIYLNIYSEDKQCKKLWQESILGISQKLLKIGVNSEIFNTYEASKLEPIFFILSILKLDNDENIANFISVCCENFENIDLEISARVVFNAELDFLLHKDFRFSKNGLLAYFVENSEKFSFSGFLERVEKFVSSNEINIELHQELVKFLSWSQMLSPNSTQQILSGLKKLKYRNDFSLLLFQYSEMPGIFDCYSKDSYNFFQVSMDSHIKDLKLRLFAYLNMKFKLPNENEFLNCIIPSLFIGENKSELLSILKFLTSRSIYQQSLKNKLLKILSKFILKDFNSYPLYILHEVFIEILRIEEFDQQILDEFEEKIFLNSMSPSFSVNLIENYSKSRRFNKYFNSLCQNLDQKIVFLYLETLKNVCKDNESYAQELGQLLSLVESKNY